MLEPWLLLLSIDVVRIAPCSIVLNTLLMDAAIDAVTQEADEQQPVQDASKQKHDQER